MWYEIVAEAIYAVFRDRDPQATEPAHLTPDFYDWLLSPQRTKEIAESMRSAAEKPAAPHDLEGPGETTHLCAADGEGCIVALTQSIQSVYGAKVANGRLGFLYNNSLCTLPRRAHPYQLRGGCVPRSNAAPTLVLRWASPRPADQQPQGRRPFMALGAAGSRRITSAIVQVISGVLDRGLSITQAVDCPRVHATLSRRIHVEAPAATESLLARLEQRFRAVEIRAARSFHMGGVQALHFGDDGSLVGAADPRRDGTAAVWPE
jgi:gamma-glutamyltranspeptidase/glutathione hydrolase